MVTHTSLNLLLFHPEAAPRFDPPTLGQVDPNTIDFLQVSITTILILLPTLPNKAEELPIQ
jgi:hypothetical protein